MVRRSLLILTMSRLVSVTIVANHYVPQEKCALVARMLGIVAARARKLAGNFTNKVQDKLDAANKEFRVAQEAVLVAGDKLKDAEMGNTEKQSRLDDANVKLNNTMLAADAVDQQIKASKADEQRKKQEVTSAKEKVTAALKQEKKT